MPRNQTDRVPSLNTPWYVADAATGIEKGMPMGTPLGIGEGARKKRPGIALRALVGWVRLTLWPSESSKF